MKQPLANTNDNDVIKEDVSLDELFYAWSDALESNALPHTYDDDDLFDKNLISALSDFKKASQTNTLQKYSLFLGHAESSVRKSPYAQQKEDWDIVSQLSGYTEEEFLEAVGTLPLTHQEISFFLRNHRNVKHHIIRDYFTIQSDLPSPIAELYGLYRYRARMDAEATLFIAQSTLSTRIASEMAKILALGAFGNGTEYIKHLTVTYSVPCAFDTSTEIMAANIEAQRRLFLPHDHPANLLRLSSNDIAVLASVIAENNALTCDEFLEKANFLAEAAQDVARLPSRERFATAIREKDIPWNAFWTKALVESYKALLPVWGEDV